MGQLYVVEVRLLEGIQFNNIKGIGIEWGDAKADIIEYEVCYYGN